MVVYVHIVWAFNCWIGRASSFIVIALPWHFFAAGEKKCKDFKEKASINPLVSMLFNFWKKELKATQNSTGKADTPFV